MKEFDPLHLWEQEDETFHPAKALRKDLADAALHMGDREARFLVATYYAIQLTRTRAQNRRKKLIEAGDQPFAIMDTVQNQFMRLEEFAKNALDIYAKRSELGRWCLKQHGIGPVISAGMLAHIDLTRADTSGKLWAFAGLTPTSRKEKGKPCPYNEKLKVLCFKMADCQLKFRNKEANFYGKFYDVQRSYYEAKNERGGFADRAAECLAGADWKTDTESYKAYIKGRLPVGQIHRMALRWVAKLFLSHYWEVGRGMMGLPIPKPYSIGQMKHSEASYIPPPP